MAHLAIYRKYRPRNFDEVSGQKTVVSILKNAINSNNVAHAYLFTGPRGTGKTSIAKIFARTVNCECLKDATPCDTCQSCLNSFSKECVDIIEIDAASNNGVDEIRELKSKINIVPSYLKYKVYIIDEVHMLSIGAFNALLKTLEEPPSHVIFILATTELQKVPSTILSRCQTLEFRKISYVDMNERIKYICDEEKISIDSDAIDEIINVSDGCMRDALSFLEKVNAFCGNKITSEDVRLVSGKTPKQFITDFIEQMVNKNCDECIKKINEAFLNDYDLLYVAEDIITELEKNIFKDKIIKIEYRDMLSKMIEIYDKLKNSSVSKKIIFEMGIFDYCSITSDKIISREIILNNNLEQSDRKKINPEKEDDESLIDSISSRANFDHNLFKKIRINNTFVGANKESLLKIKNIWENLKKHVFDKETGSIVCTLIDGLPVAASNNYAIIGYQYETETSKINENYALYQKVIKDYLSMDINIVAISLEEWNKSKKEYINKLNKKEKYDLLSDNFCDIKMNKEEDINNDTSQFFVENTIDDKLLDLFGTENIEIK